MKRVCATLGALVASALGIITLAQCGAAGGPADLDPSLSDGGSAPPGEPTASVSTSAEAWVSPPGSIASANALSGLLPSLEEANLFGPTRASLTVSALVDLLQPRWGFHQELAMGNVKSWARFGRSIAISGSTAVVGAYQENGTGSQAGSAYVFVRTGNVWSYQAQLKPSDPGSIAQFGESVAISGDTIAVGASQADEPGAVRAGAAYVFQRTGTTWTEQARVKSPASEAWEAFGVAVAVSGDTLVVGAPDRSQGGAADAGAAYIFTRTGTSWSAAVPLAAPSPVLQDYFGSSVAVVGNKVVVGASGRNAVGATDSGAAFVYQLSGGVWSLAQTIRASDRQTGDRFGGALALEAGAGGTTRLLVGAAGVDLPAAADTGAAYVFDQPASGTFIQSQKLVASDAAANQFFGTSVALAGSRLVIGASGTNGVALRTGAGYTFVRSGSVWSADAKLSSPTSPMDAHLGGAVAMAGSQVLLGSTEEFLPPTLEISGAVHAFRRGALGSWSESHVLNAELATPYSSYGRDISLSASTLVLTSTNQVDVLRRDLAGWALSQQIPAPASSSYRSASSDGSRLAIASTSLSGGSTLTGAIDVYAPSPTGVWTNEQQLLPDLAGIASNESASSLKVKVDGTTLVASACRFNGGDGQVYVYTRSGTIWTLQQTLTSDLAAVNFDMNFGDTVLLQGDTLIISEVPSSGIPDPSLPRFGKVHVFARSGGLFSLTQTITATVPAALDHFGDGVALDGDNLAVVGPGAVGTRTLHMYHRSAGLFAEVFTTAIPDQGRRGLALQGSFLAVGLESADPDGLTNAGEVQMYRSAPGNTWALETTLKAPDEAAGAFFGGNLSLLGNRLIVSKIPSGASAAPEVYSFERASPLLITF